MIVVGFHGENLAEIVTVKNKIISSKFNDMTLNYIYISGRHWPQLTSLTRKTEIVFNYTCSG